MTVPNSYDRATLTVDGKPVDVSDYGSALVLRVYSSGGPVDGLREAMRPVVDAELVHVAREMPEIMSKVDTRPFRFANAGSRCGKVSALKEALRRLTEAGIAVLPGGGIEAQTLRPKAQPMSGVRVAHESWRGFDGRWPGFRRWRTVNVEPCRVRACRGRRKR